MRQKFLGEAWCKEGFGGAERCLLGWFWGWMQMVASSLTVFFDWLHGWVTPPYAATAAVRTHYVRPKGGSADMGGLGLLYGRMRHLRIGSA
jgi:hypothetical protein